MNVRRRAARSVRRAHGVASSHRGKRSVRYRSSKCARAVPAVRARRRRRRARRAASMQDPRGEPREAAAMVPRLACQGGAGFAEKYFALDVNAGEDDPEDPRQAHKRDTPLELVRARRDRACRQRVDDSRAARWTRVAPRASRPARRRPRRRLTHHRAQAQARRRMRGVGARRAVAAASTSRVQRRHAATRRAMFRTWSPRAIVKRQELVSRLRRRELVRGERSGAPEWPSRARRRPRRSSASTSSTRSPSRSIILMTRRPTRGCPTGIGSRRTRSLVKAPTSL